MDAMLQSGLIENLFVFVPASFLGLELIGCDLRLVHTPPVQRRVTEQRRPRDQSLAGREQRRGCYG